MEMLTGMEVGVGVGFVGEGDKQVKCDTNQWWIQGKVPPLFLGPN